MTIGESIKQARTAKGFTQKQLGVISGTSEITIRQYELGKRQPWLEQFQAIAAALGVSVLSLLGADTPEARQLMRWDAQRMGKSLAEIEGETAQDILDDESTDRLISALGAADLAVIQAFAEIPDNDILLQLHTIVDDELTRDGRILALKRIYELSNMVGYGRFAPLAGTRVTPPKDTAPPSDAPKAPPEGK